MKALTLTQPWATLVAIGAKRIETRSWTTAHRGPVAIHAAKGFPFDARDCCLRDPFADVLHDAGYSSTRALPLGCVVAVADLDSVWRFIPPSECAIRTMSGKGYLPPFEADFGDYSHGRFGFLLKKGVHSLATPIPARGMLGLWELPKDVMAAIEEAIP